MKTKVIIEVQSNLSEIPTDLEERLEGLLNTFLEGVFSYDRRGSQSTVTLLDIKTGNHQIYQSQFSKDVNVRMKMEGELRPLL